MAKAGLPKPTGKHSLSCAFKDYTTIGSSSYRLEVREGLKRNRPDWFLPPKEATAEEKDFIKTHSYNLTPVAIMSELKRIFGVQYDVSTITRLIRDGRQRFVADIALLSGPFTRSELISHLTTIGFIKANGKLSNGMTAYHKPELEYPNLWTSLLSYTAFLNDDASYAERLFNLQAGTTERQLCAVSGCSAPVKFNQTYYYETCGLLECWKIMRRGKWSPMQAAAAKRRRLRRFEAVYNHLFNTGHECTIAYEEFVDIIAPSKCHYCWTHLIFAEYTKAGVSQAYQIDRKDNDLGYVPGNCVPCCWSCNDGKSDKFSYDQWYKMMTYKRGNSVRDRCID